MITAVTQVGYPAMQLRGPTQPPAERLTDLRLALGAAGRRKVEIERERIAEIAARAGELAEIQDAWILSQPNCSVSIGYNSREGQGAVHSIMSGHERTSLQIVPPKGPKLARKR